jgi:hypothetical protein
MTTNSSNQPNRTPPQNGYNPITLEDVQKPASCLSPDYMGGRSELWARWVATPLLGFIFVYTHRVPLVGSPFAIVVLLGCLLARMDHHPRQIAGVPLTLAAIKLTFEMGSRAEFSGPHGMPADFAMDPGLVWLPMFFAICLVFMPRRDSVTFKIVFAGSAVLLASGLLPGQSFVAIFYLLDTTLFIAMIVGIFLDLKTYMAHQVQNNLRPAL